MPIRSDGWIGGAMIGAVIAGAVACSGSPAARSSTRSSGSTGPGGSEPHRSPRAAANSGAAAPTTTAGQSALEALRASMAAGESTALAVMSVVLVPAAGAREMTGEIALDERVDRATIVTRSADAAAVLVVTTCGNATLGTLRWDGTLWRASAHADLIAGMHPGRCAQTTVRAESLPLSSDARHEIAVVFVSLDATGESVRGPFLSVFHLGDAGALGTMLAEATFGSVDDETGATTQGEYAVIEDVPPPRDLHVAIRPGTRGPGGAPLPEISRRRYALRGNRLEMVQQSTERAE